MYVKPSPGLKVRDPDLKDLLPEEGRLVPDSMYWHRRLRDQDVELAPPVQDRAVPGADSSNKPE